MEVELATRTGCGLALLDNELKLVAYSGEAFRHNAEFLEPFKKRPEFNEDLPRQVAKSLIEHKTHKFWDGLCDCELAISYICRTMPHPQQSLKQFCDEWRLKELPYASDLRIGHIKVAPLLVLPIEWCRPRGET